jgi:hypothetical protein
MLAEQILSSGNALLAKHIKVNGLSPKSLCPTLSQHKNTALRGTYGSYQEPKSWQHSTWVIFQKHPKAISLSTNKNSLTKYVYFFGSNDIKWILQTSGIIPSHLPPSRSKVLPGFLRLLGCAQGLHRDLQVLRAGYLPSMGTAWQELSPWAHQNDGSP